MPAGKGVSLNRKELDVINRDRYGFRGLHTFAEHESAADDQQHCNQCAGVLPLLFEEAAQIVDQQRQDRDRGQACCADEDSTGNGMAVAEHPERLRSGSDRTADPL